MELDGEEITPLKRRRKKKEKDSLSDADSIKASKEPAEKNQLTPTKKKSSKTKNIAFISPAKESPCKNLEKKTTIDNPESFKGVFCSSNNKPDMMFFKPRDSEDVTRDKLIHCPICHINLQFLHGTTPQCHINQCLDSQPDFEQSLLLLMILNSKVLLPKLRSCYLYGNWSSENLIRHKTKNFHCKFFFLKYCISKLMFE